MLCSRDAKRIQYDQRAKCIIAVASLAAWLCLPMLVAAQASKSKKAAPHAEKKTGKIAKVDSKGKSSTLTVEEADGETFDVLVTAKMKNFLIKGKGDVGFLKHPHVVVSSDSVFTANMQFFGKKFTVHLGQSPEAVFEPDPNNAEVYHVAGPIVDCDETSFTINVSGSPYKVNFEQGLAPEVAVESTEPELAAVGADIELEGKARSGRFQADSILITLDKPLSSDDVFSKNDKKAGKSKTAAATKGMKKSAKSDKSDPAEKGDDTGTDPAKPPATSDPFGVLKDNKPKPGGGKPKPKKPSDESGSP
jgi:hypothetical protein